SRVFPPVRGLAGHGRHDSMPLSGPRRGLPRFRPRTRPAALERRLREPEVARGRHDGAGVPEPTEALGEAHVAQGVMIHDHATPGSPTTLRRLSMPRSITLAPTSRSMYEGGPDR